MGTYSTANIVRSVGRDEYHTRSPRRKQATQTLEEKIAHLQACRKVQERVKSEALITANESQFRATQDTIDWIDREIARLRARQEA